MSSLFAYIIKKQYNIETKFHEPIMKKLLAALLLCMGTQADASICGIFKISVKNDTPSTCYLVQRTVKSGVITKHQSYKIKPGFTMTQFELEEKDHQSPGIIITYECSENQTITLLSTKQSCTYQNGGKIEGIIVKADHLNAVFTSNEGNYFLKKPGLIQWIIS